MLKAVFVDYTGTLIKEGGPHLTEMVKRCYKNSDVESPERMLRYWWNHLKILEEQSCGDNYKTEDEIVDILLELCVKEFHLKDNLDELHKLCQQFWVYAPAFEDAKPFLEKCPLPVYILTNNGISYVKKAMEDKGLQPDGIITGDMAKAYKPHRELFEKALEISGCTAAEVIHIGDSVTSDVKGALAAGIRPVLVNREGGKELENIPVVHSLLEALEYIKYNT